MTKSARHLSLLVFAVALIGLLLILGPNLQRIKLEPGTQNLSFLDEVESGLPDLGTNPTGASAVAILLRIAMTAALVSAVGIVVAAIFSRRLRLYVIAFCLCCAVLFGLYYLMMLPGIMAARTGDVEELQSPADELLGTDPGAAADEPPPSSPPGWSFAAVAIGLSIGVVVLAAVAWTRLAPRWRLRNKDDKSELEELLETVAAAADEIHLGGDPRSAVLRCYREMVRILCRGKTIDYVHMTARELAAALHRVGFTTQHVDQLTEIFELVRYGNRTGKPLAERAVGCLEAIREAYAT